MTLRHPCQAVQYSDQMVCYPCSLTWNTNDPDPPYCLPEVVLQETEPRPTLVDTFSEIVDVISKRSTCSRLKVGCLVTDENLTSVLAIGYNGNSRGLPNECDRQQPGNCGCIHAEENLLIKAPYGPKLILFCTHSPCVPCAKKVLNSSIIEVYYNRVYRSKEGIQLLQCNNVPCTFLNRV